MKTNISTTHCAVENCRTTILNKAPNITFHPFPTSTEMRNKWLKVLKNKCTMIDLAKSRICSKHFDHKSFDSQKKLKDSAVPTLFVTPTPKNKYDYSIPRVDRLLNKMTQSDLQTDIKASMSRMKEPANFDNYITDNLKCKPGSPTDTELWLIIKKQDNLNTRLMDLVVQTKKHVEILQNNMEDTKNVRKESEQTVESLKYIVKCLQEKHASLEEQIEILTAVEAR